MQTNHFIYIAALMVVSGCTVQPTGNGGYQLSTPSLASILNSPANSTTNPAASPADSSSQGPQQQDAINYSGQIDGGTAKAVLTPISPTQYHFEIGATGRNANGQITGAGGASGILTKAGDVYIMTRADDGNACYLTVSLSGNELKVDEDFAPGRLGCMAEHGESLSFDGILYRDGS